MEILMIIGLILLNGIFSMSEISLVSARKFKLENAAKKGNVNAKKALDLANSPNTFLSTVQIGITLIGIVSGAVSGATAAGAAASAFVGAGCGMVCGKAGEGDWTSALPTRNSGPETSSVGNAKVATGSSSSPTRARCAIQLRSAAERF